MRPLGAGALLLASALFSGGALAHNPMCECKQIDGEQIRCTGGFSDGSGAPGVTLDVIGYDETILVPGKLGADSTLTFKKPDAEFYVLFDAGPGHVVEIDQADIEAP
ncbi:hypothetical protein IMY95_29155 [Pseudomonas chlororaphis]|nr:hypothetical protein [Pseudomonas chlororaphis]MDO1503614.1 hypothetical protein [Pseudomonas chlororaphis]